MKSVLSFLFRLLLLVLFFCPGAAVVLAQEHKTYVNQQHGFAFAYPAAYKLKVAGDYLDFNKAGKTLYSLRVDDRFIEMLYQMLHPGPVVYREGEDPYRELARETRKNQDLFRRYARNEAKNWCSADGPDGSVYCRDLKSEKPFTSQVGLNCLEFYLIMIREDFTNHTKEQREVGPILAALVPKEERPLVLTISPRHGQLASPELALEMREIIESLRITP
jgi:hypothetical protein